MSLLAGVLCVVLSLAQAQSPRSLILTTISPAGASGPLSAVIKSLDTGGRKDALTALDRLDRGALDTAALTELSEAYRLLGRTKDAVAVAGILSAIDAQSSAGDTQAVLALTQAGNYAAAQTAAENGLKRFPGDQSLLALLYEVKDRGGRGVASGQGPSAQTSVQSSVARPDSARPYVLPIKTKKGAAPPIPTSAYLSPDQEKPSTLSMIGGGLWNMAVYNVDTESPAESKRMMELRVKLDGTETGKALVADLGGWEKIQRTVDLRFAGVWDDGTNAYARPLFFPAAAGQRSALVMNKKLLSQPDAVVVPILAHELGHVRDNETQSTAHGLAVPSEFSAHRTQVQVFEELKAKMTAEEIAALENNPRGRYQNFIALLWEDHLLQRYKTPRDMASAIGSVPKFQKRAEQVLSDLRSGRIAPGGPQLDYHLNGAEGGLYRNLSGEKDIVDLIAERLASGNYTAEQRIKDQDTLVKRAALLAQSDKRDIEFRTKHGFLIEAGK